MPTGDPTAAVEREGLRRSTDGSSCRAAPPFFPLSTHRHGRQPLAGWRTSPLRPKTSTCSRRFADVAAEQYDRARRTDANGDGSAPSSTDRYHVPKNQHDVDAHLYQMRAHTSDRTTKGRVAVQCEAEKLGDAGALGRSGGTGRHGGLKSRCPQGRAGSTPASGTTPQSLTRESLRLYREASRGAVAQLGEHKAGSLGVRGSNPLSSTISHPPRYSRFTSGSASSRWPGPSKRFLPSSSA